MGNITRSVEHADFGRLKNSSDISNIVIYSQNFHHATELLASYLAEMSLHMLYVGGYDPDGNSPGSVVYSDFPDNLTKMCACFDNRHGCPLVQLALKGGKSFEALNLYLSGFEDFFSMRYLKELQRLGYDQIGVIPVLVEKQVFVFFVGLDNFPFRDEIQDRLDTAIAQFIAAASVKYPIGNLPIRFEAESGTTTCGSIKITRLEMDCLAGITNGKTNREISEKSGLSEHTVGICIKNTCKQLNATDRAHAIAKAIQLGIIDIPQQPESTS